MSDPERTPFNLEPTDAGEQLAELLAERLTPRELRIVRLRSEMNVANAEATYNRYLITGLINETQIRDETSNALAKLGFKNLHQAVYELCLEGSIPIRKYEREKYGRIVESLHKKRRKTIETFMSGLSIAEAAPKLGINTKSLHVGLSRIYKDFDVSSLEQLIRAGFAGGIRAPEKSEKAILPIDEITSGDQFMGREHVMSFGAKYAPDFRLQIPSRFAFAITERTSYPGPLQNLYDVLEVVDRAEVGMEWLAERYGVPRNKQERECFDRVARVSSVVEFASRIAVAESLMPLRMDERGREFSGQLAAFLKQRTSDTLEQGRDDAVLELREDSPNEGTFQIDR